jgi:uncharacterized membrane-anchored protein
MSLPVSILLAATLAAPFEQPESQDTTAVELDSAQVRALIEQYQDSATAGFTFQHGTVSLENGVATLTLPEGFKFLDKTQSERVIVELWGNPDANGVMGMIFPEADDVLADSSYAFVVQYDEIGFVKDDDADDIDYDDMLKELQKGEKEENEQRVQAGYDPAYLVGWAAKPFYDKERKILHWAKEIKFGDSAEVNTLNYNVRVLGRKGVLILNAVANMSELPLVQQHVNDVLGIVQFNDGYKYEQFDSKVDDVAAWTIGGLVAGKVLAKVGILAVLAKFGKVIIIGLIAAGGAIWRFVTGRKKDEQPPAPPAAIS